jgi:site-specific DNA-methyltransferase (adenine-specific)
MQIELHPNQIPEDLKKYFRPKRRYGPFILRNVIVWHKPNCMPSSVKDRFTINFEYLFFFVKNKKYYFEQQFEPHLTKEKRPDGIVRNREYGYDSKLNAINKKSHTLIALHKGEKNPDFLNPKGRNMRSVWKVPTHPYPEAHFATYPEKLCETPIKAGCPNGGIVLDPFIGSGTTALVALKQNKKFIGIELNPEYIKMANKRLNPLLEQTKL